jgi:O-antigen/teichoic acid export membrane protein
MRGVSETSSAVESTTERPATGIAGRLRVLLHDRSHDAIAKRTALLAFAIRVASAAIAYLSQIVLARWMGVHDYGIYVFVWTLVLFLGNVAGLGFSVASLRFVAEHLEGKQFGLLRGYLMASRASAFVAGTVLAGIGFVAVRLAGGWVESHYVWPLLLCLACLPSFAITEIQDGMARSINAPAIALAPPYLLRPLLLVGIMAAQVHFGVTLSAAAAVEAAIVATWVTLAVQYLLLARKLRAIAPPARPELRMRYWLGASLPILFAEAAGVLCLNVDVFILALFVPPAELGVYYAVTKTLVLGAFVSFAVGAGVAHRYAEYHVAGDHARLQAFVLRSTAWTFWPTLATVVVMVALGRPFLALFGPGFVEGYPLMLILACGLLVRAALGPVDRLLSILGQQGASVRIVLITLFLAVALQFALVPPFGPIGAAIAVSLTAVAQGAMLSAVARQRLGLKVGIWHRGARP